MTHQRPSSLPKIAQVFKPWGLNEIVLMREDIHKFLMNCWTCKSTAEPNSCNSIKEFFSRPLCVMMDYKHSATKEAAQNSEMMSESLMSKQELAHSQIRAKELTKINHWSHFQAITYLNIMISSKLSSSQLSLFCSLLLQAPRILRMKRGRRKKT